MARRIIHIIGSGTIADPLIGILGRKRDKLGIDEITFQPDIEALQNKILVKGLTATGAKLCVDKKHADAFASQGLKVEYDEHEALDRAMIIIDCTRNSPIDERKYEIYRQLPYADKLFIAQSTTPNFGKDFAYFINDASLVHGEDHFLRISSCNSHNIAALIKCLTMDKSEQCHLSWGRFVCIRRSSDLSEEQNYVPSPTVDIHKDMSFGTYQGADVARLFESIGYNLDIHCSSLKVNTQYLHTVHFSVQLDHKITLPEIIDKMEEDPLIALTNKRMAGTVLAFIREMGYQGRILNQSVVSVPSLQIVNDNEITGFSFSPQDGNSILSSIAAALWFLYPKTYQKKIEQLHEFLFPEV